MTLTQQVPASSNDNLIDNLASSIFERLVGVGFDAPEHYLKLRLALEHHLTGGSVPFGLDRLNTDDAANYLGLQAETLRSTSKRRSLNLPTPYNFGKKLFWRRSELDAWLEQQRGRK